MKEMQSRRKIASVTNGLSSSPSGGTAMPMNTSAETARVPWPPIHVRARTGRAMLCLKLNGIQILLERTYCEAATMRQPRRRTKSHLVTLCCRVALNSVQRLQRRQASRNRHVALGGPIQSIELRDPFA